jgi:hypothetical protein
MRLNGCKAADRDDAAGAGFSQMRDGCAQNLRRGSKIQIAHLLPGGIVGFRHGRAADNGACDVHQHI